MPTHTSSGAFIPAGRVRISDSARRLALLFANRVRAVQPDYDFVVAFDWAHLRRVRQPNTNNWRDLGAGLDLAAYERQQVPSAAIQITEGLEFSVKISENVLTKENMPLIDVDETLDPPRLVLR